MTTPLVSIVVRSRNDAAFMRRTLEALRRQRLRDFEILSFDNASTDGTRAILDDYEEVRRFDVPEGAYVPGRVLNRAVGESLGRWIVFNNADAVPLDEGWLEALVEPLRAGRAEAVYARQVCRPDADVWVKMDYARAFGDAAFSAEFFSMASSAATKAVLEKYPFDDKITYSEDVFWAKGLRAAGVSVAYAPDARAEHSHNYTPSQTRKRFYGEGFADGEIYGTPLGLCALARALLGAWARDAVWLAKNGAVRAWPRAIKQRWIQKRAYFKGRADYFAQKGPRA